MQLNVLLFSIKSPTLAAYAEGLGIEYQPHRMSNIMVESEREAIAYLDRLTQQLPNDANVFFNFLPVKENIPAGTVGQDEVQV